MSDFSATCPGGSLGFRRFVARRLPVTLPAILQLPPPDRFPVDWAAHMCISILAELFRATSREFANSQNSSFANIWHETRDRLLGLFGTPSLIVSSQKRLGIWCILPGPARFRFKRLSWLPIGGGSACIRAS